MRYCGKWHADVRPGFYCTAKRMFRICTASASSTDMVAVPSPCPQRAQRCPYVLPSWYNPGICSPHAVTNPPTTNTSAAELIAGEKYMPSICYAYAPLIQYSALKYFILSGAWRDARYLHEPR